VAFAATPDEDQRVSVAGQRLMTALGLRMEDTARRSSPASRVLDLNSREPVEVIEELARVTEQQVGGIRAPLPWIDNALPGARVEAERQAAQRRQDDRLREAYEQRLRQDRENERRQAMRTPEQVAEDRRKLASLSEAFA
jgi:hypothetical protein